jgi:hypothetical protein
MHSPSHRVYTATLLVRVTLSHHCGCFQAEFLGKRTKRFFPGYGLISATVKRPKFGNGP